MTIRHHLREETLLAYAAGTLVPALSAVVASHVSVCSKCRDELRFMQRIGGALLGGLKAEGAAVRLERTMAAVRNLPPERAPSWEAPDRVLPRPLARHLGMGIKDIPWKKVGPGVRQFKVPLPKGGGDLRVVSVKPGAELPHHGHYGMELTMVIAGAYNDETGEYHNGDVADLDEDVEHMPRAMGTEPCICILAGETHPRYSSFAIRMLRPFFGY